MDQAFPIENLEQGKLDQVAPGSYSSQARALIESAKKLFDGNTLAYLHFFFYGFKVKEL